MTSQYQSSSAPKTIGIDVAKNHFDLHLHPTNKAARFANTTAGRRAAFLFIQEASYDGAFVIMEASGGYERKVRQAFSQADFPVCVVQPARVWNFIRALGVQAKTDQLDAKALALFAASGMVKPSTALDETRLALRDLTRTLTALKKQASTIKGDLEKSVHPETKKAFKSLLKSAERQIASITKSIQSMLEDTPNIAQTVALLETVPGIGWQTAVILVAELPEMGACSKEQIAALVGVAPYTNQSGKCQGKARIKGGRHHARTALYMATLTASRYNPYAKHIYQNFKKTGKPFKVALTATMRKLLVVLNSMVKNNTAWNEKQA